MDIVVYILVFFKFLVLVDSVSLVPHGIGTCFYGQEPNALGTDCHHGNCNTPNHTRVWIDLLQLCKVSWLMIDECPENYGRSAMHILITFATDIDEDLNITITDQFSIDLDNSKDMSFPQPIKSRFVVLDVLSQADNMFLMFKNIEIHGSPCTECPKNWELSLDGTLCYLIYSTKATISEAEQICNQLDSVLYEPTSANAIYRVLVMALPFGINRVWSGLKYIENSTLTTSNGTIVSSKSELHQFDVVPVCGNCVTHVFLGEYDTEMQTRDCESSKSHVVCEKASTNICISSKGAAESTVYTNTNSGFSTTQNNIVTTLMTTINMASSTGSTNKITSVSNINTITETAKAQETTVVPDTDTTTTTETEVTTVKTGVTSVQETEVTTLQETETASDLVAKTETTVEPETEVTIVKSETDATTVPETEATTVSGTGETIVPATETPTVPTTGATADIITEPATVSHSTTSGSTESVCPCNCFTTLEKQMETLNEIIQSLTIDKKDLSSYRRSKTCAEDNRPAAVFTGAVGVVVLTFVITVIVMFDVANFLLGISVK